MTTAFAFMEGQVQDLLEEHFPEAEVYLDSQREANVAYSEGDDIIVTWRLTPTPFANQFCIEAALEMTLSLPQNLDRPIRARLFKGVSMLTKRKLYPEASLLLTLQKSKLKRLEKIDKECFQVNFSVFQKSYLEEKFEWEWDE